MPNAQPNRKLFAAEKARLARSQGPGKHPAAFSVVDGATLDDVMTELRELRKLVEAGGNSAVADDTQLLQGQLFDLSQSIRRTKHEIAAIHHPSANEDRLTNATMELDEVVMATEEATNHILEAAEVIGDTAEQLRSHVADNPLAGELIEILLNQSTTIFENCNFQDLTGQRIGKVIRTIGYLEDRINRMIEIWGAEDFEDVPIPVEEKPKEDDKALMSGPAKQGEGISQSDIDALFD